MSNRDLKLDLHKIYNNGYEIDRKLEQAMNDAVVNGAHKLEIVHGKGSGQLKKHVLRYLNQKEIKSLYSRVDKDQHNHGRLFVYF